MDNNYTVYMHTCPNGKRYVGITGQSPQKRWANGKSYTSNPYFTKAIKKYGWENIKHEILFQGLTKAESESKEIELIAFYQSNNMNYGYNLQNGGSHNGKHSDDIKRKISEFQKGEKSIWYGKKHTEKEKQLIGNAHRGKIVSKERRQKLSESIRRKRQIKQYALNGEYIQTFDDLVSAGESLSVKDYSRCVIDGACNGKYKTAFGYIWRYANNDFKICPNVKYHGQNKVIQLDLNGIFVNKYESIRIAAKETKCKVDGISNSCRGKQKTAYGYIWQYAE